MSNLKVARERIEVLDRRIEYLNRTITTRNCRWQTREIVALKWAVNLAQAAIDSGNIKDLDQATKQYDERLRSKDSSNGV